MTVQFRPDPRRPFKAVSDALAQGIQQGYQKRQSADLLDQVIGNAVNQEGDLLTNLLSGLQGSGATFVEGLEAVQRFAPLIQQQQKADITNRQNQLTREFLGEDFSQGQVGQFPVTGQQLPGSIVQEGIDETTQTPTSQNIFSLSQISDREQLRQQHQANAGRIIANQDALGQQNAKFLLDLNQSLFDSRDNELDSVEKERLKVKTDAQKRFANKADESTDAAMKAQNVKLALEPVIDAIRTNQSGVTVRNVLAEAADKLPEGPLTSSLQSLLKTPAQQVFKVGQGSFFKSLKESFGANVSTVETQMFMSSLFQFATDPEAQEFAVEYQNILADRQIAAAEIMNSLLDADGVPVPNARQKFDREMKKVLEEGEKQLRETDYWKKTNVKKIEKQAVDTKFKRDFLKNAIGPQ